MQLQKTSLSRDKEESVDNFILAHRVKQITDLHVVCSICGFKSSDMGKHLKSKHNMLGAAYTKKYGKSYKIDNTVRLQYIMAKYIDAANTDEYFFSEFEAVFGSVMKQLLKDAKDGKIRNEKYWNDRGIYTQ